MYSIFFFRFPRSTRFVFLAPVPIVFPVPAVNSKRNRCNALGAKRPQLGSCGAGRQFCRSRDENSQEQNPPRPHDFFSYFRFTFETLGPFVRVRLPQSASTTLRRRITGTNVSTFRKPLENNTFRADVYLLSTVFFFDERFRASRAVTGLIGFHDRKNLFNCSGLGALRTFSSPIPSSTRTGNTV